MCPSHEHLNVTTVNTYGLIYEWKGSNSALKPVLLAAHQGEDRGILAKYGLTLCRYGPGRADDCRPVDISSLVRTLRW
jgi:hypothetical protein